MFTRLFYQLPMALALSTIPILAAATSLAESDVLARRQFGTCDTGPVLCCNQVESSYSNIGQSLMALFGVSGVDYGEIGLTCTPITVIGAGGSSCSAQPVCCMDNSWNGVIAFGCFPVNIGL